MNIVVKLAVALVLSAAVATNVSAQGVPKDHPKPDPARVEAMKELKSSIKTFAQETILPQVRTWKARLDAAMSPEDLAALNGLRARATVLRRKFIEHAMEMRTAWESEDYAALKTHRDAMKGLVGEKDAIANELKPIAMKYLPALMEIGADAKPVIATWKQSGKEIFATWQAKHKDQLGARPMGEPHMRGPHMEGGDHPNGEAPNAEGPKGECPKGACPKDGAKLGGHMMKEMGLGMFGGRMGKKAMVAYFMLWDGGDVLNELENAMSSPEGSEFLPNLD